MIHSGSISSRFTNFPEKVLQYDLDLGVTTAPDLLENSCSSLPNKVSAEFTLRIRLSLADSESDGGNPSSVSDRSIPSIEEGMNLGLESGRLESLVVFLVASYDIVFSAFLEVVLPAWLPKNFFMIGKLKIALNGYWALVLRG